MVPQVKARGSLVVCYDRLGTALIHLANTLAAFEDLAPMLRKTGENQVSALFRFLVVLFVAAAVTLGRACSSCLSSSLSCLIFWQSSCPHPSSFFLFLSFFSGRAHKQHGASAIEKKLTAREDLKMTDLLRYYVADTEAAKVPNCK